jgi:hypothetical protein
MTQEFMTEAGPRPEFESAYGAIALETDSYPARTWANVRASDGTLWFGAADSSGGRCTLGACRELDKPVHLSDVARWLTEHRIRSLNVAGNRESRSPGIGHRVEAFLYRLFARTQIPIDADHPRGEP